MTGTYYDTNETMQLLGHQCIGILMETEEFKRDFHNMLDGHKEGRIKDYYSIVIDALMLGFIYGKREERAKRKKR